MGGRFIEILLILLCALLLFGAKRLPDLARALGKAIGEFRSGLGDAAKQPAPPAEPPKEKHET